MSKVIPQIHAQQNHAQTENVLKLVENFSTAESEEDVKLSASDMKLLKQILEERKQKESPLELLYEEWKDCEISASDVISSGANIATWKVRLSYVVKMLEFFLTMYAICGLQPFNPEESESIPHVHQVRINNISYSIKETNWTEEASLFPVVTNFFLAILFGVLASSLACSKALNSLSIKHWTYAMKHKKNYDNIGGSQLDAYSALSIGAITFLTLISYNTINLEVILNATALLFIAEFDELTMSLFITEEEKRKLVLNYEREVGCGFIFVLLALAELFKAFFT